MEDFNYFLVFGLGCLWLGSQIIWVAGLPRQLQSGEKKTAEKGSPQALCFFGLINMRGLEFYFLYLALSLQF